MVTVKENRKWTKRNIMSITVPLLLFSSILASRFPHLHGEELFQSSITSLSLPLEDWESDYTDVHDIGSLRLGSSCADLTTCDNCTNTYTCHWCEKSESCHARGSLYGCTWGSTCHKEPPKPKENSTCATHSTCSDCALASHFCHWCEHDNACHMVGSPYGCAIGVDCYSNDRCRRKESEPLPGGFFHTEISTIGLIVVLSVGAIFVGCLTCCHYFTTNVKGAYDDLATITMAASMAPMSVIGGPAGQFYTTLEPHPEETSNVDDGIVEMEQQPQQSQLGSTEDEEEANQPTFEDALQDPQQAAQSGEVSQSPYLLMNDTDGHDLVQEESRALLHPSFHGNSVVGTIEEPRHMKNLYRFCSIIYYISVFLVLTMVGMTILYYPKQPVYSVCNDAVAWKRIMTNIAAFKFDASFEILISLSNPNRIDAALDRGKGAFSFEGKQIGTFEIPPATADAMAINDLMLIVHISPDRQQALQLAEAYYMGTLILEAQFEGTIRLPSLFDYTLDVNVKHIEVDVNELADRSLCHCPSWDDGKNHTDVALPNFF